MFTQKAANSGFAVDVSDRGLVGPPVTQDEFLVSNGVRMRLEVRIKHGGLRAPVGLAPKAPHQDGFDGLVAKHRSIEVTKIRGLQFPVICCKVKLSYLDRQSQGGEAVCDLEQALGRGQLRREVTLHARFRLTVRRLA